MTAPRGPTPDVPDVYAFVETPAGAWHLAWDAVLGTFRASHWRETPSGVREDHHLGAGHAAIPSVGALEELLGFCLPRPIGDALAADKERRPALMPSRHPDIPEAETLRGLDTYPEWASWAQALRDGEPFRWGARLEAERDGYLRSVELGAGTRLDVIAASPDRETASLQVSYRLSVDGRPVFSADDISAPVGADVTTDDSVRALVAVLTDPDPAHRARPLSLAQQRFLEQHRAEVVAAVTPPAPPYPPGTRIAVLASGRMHTGVVAWPICQRGQATAYAWRPDVAALVGHTWRLHTGHHLVSPAAQVMPTLAGPDLGHADQLRLAFGAIVAFPSFGSGERTEATVLRAVEGPAYEVQPHAGGEPVVVNVENLTVVRGTWWPTAAALRQARELAGIPVAPGEQLVALDSSPPPVGRAAIARPVGCVEDRVQGEAALLVGVGPRPPVLRLDVHGTLTRVGDPHHGWLVVPTERLLAGLATPPAALRRGLADNAVALNGDEAHPVLAALAARHTPELLPPAPVRERRALPRVSNDVGAGL